MQIADIRERDGNLPRRSRPGRFCRPNFVNQDVDARAPIEQVKAVRTRSNFHSTLLAEGNKKFKRLVRADWAVGSNRSSAGLGSDRRSLRGVSPSRVERSTAGMTASYLLAMSCTPTPLRKKGMTSMLNTLEATHPQHALEEGWAFRTVMLSEGCGCWRSDCPPQALYQRRGP